MHGVPVDAALVPAVKLQERAFVTCRKTPDEFDIPWFDYVRHLCRIGRLSSAYSNNYFFAGTKFHFLVRDETLDAALEASDLVYAWGVLNRQVWQPGIAILPHGVFSTRQSGDWRSRAGSYAKIFRRKR